MAPGLRFDVDRFVARASRLRFPHVFNPYAETCALHDSPGSPRIRRQNLAGYLRGALRVRPESLWIGRDLGYRGGRRTGLPLTDEAHLDDLRQAYRAASVRKATRTAVVREATATQVWSVINQLKPAPLLWNVVPLHPHWAGVPLSNRRHEAWVGRACEFLLLELLESFRPPTVCAIGRDAQGALARLGVTHHPVRHPSHGGVREFRETLSALYGWASGGRQGGVAPARVGRPEI